MRVYLVQHGEAKLKDEDPKRPLTQKGAMEVRRMAAFLKPLGLKVGAVWHSDKLRAVETAEFLGRAVGSTNGVAQRNDMGPDSDIQPVLAQIGKDGTDIMLVGHMPFLSKLAGKLLAGSESAEPVAFRQGGVVCLTQADGGGQWQLAWALTPDVV
jgi:phosphohistidine phosphatase